MQFWEEYIKMCFHGNQHLSVTNHSFISLYFRYQLFIFFCLPFKNSPVFSSLDDVFCSLVQQFRLQFHWFSIKTMSWKTYIIICSIKRCNNDGQNMFCLAIFVCPFLSFHYFGVHHKSQTQTSPTTCTKTSIFCNFLQTHSVGWIETKAPWAKSMKWERDNQGKTWKFGNAWKIKVE